MARNSAALLIDSDLKGLESLVYGFQGADWRSTACPSPETAALLIKASAADILVITSREPHEKTLAMLRQLRANEESRALPMLVMGPASLRPDVLECGSIGFLPTPVFVRDAITASHILVSLGSDPEPTIDGTLAEFGLFSILRAMSGLMRSGVLQVERAGCRGEILFSDGEVTGAQMGSLQGSPAIHHLLIWEDAKVELRLRAVGRRAQFTQRFDQMMDEAELFVRDYNHAIRGIGPSSSVYERNEAKQTGPNGGVPSEVMPVIRLCDGQRTLADIIDQSPFRVFDTVRILTRLVDLGILSRREPKDAAAAPTPALQRFWETARIADPDDRVASVPAQEPASEHVAQPDSRSGEPNRRKMQRRARADTPVLGTPSVNLRAAEPPPAQGLAAEALAPAPLAVEPARVVVFPAPAATPVAQAASKAGVSGTLEFRANDRRQGKIDRRDRPSVTIDAELVEAVIESPPSGAQGDTARAESPSRSGRVTGSLALAHSPQVASDGGSVAIDPGLGSEATLLAHDSPAVAPAEPLATTAASEPAAAGASQTAGSPLSVVSSQQAATAAPPAPGSLPVPQTLPTTTESGSAATSQKDKPRTAQITGTLSITPSQRIGLARTPGKGASVQLDPILVAELNRLERATTPSAPPESALLAASGPVAPPARPEAAGPAPAMDGSGGDPTKSGSAARITGTLSGSGPSRSSARARTTPTADLSVALDPGLVEEAQTLDAREPRSGVTAAHGRPPSGTYHSPDGDAAPSSARISGAFSAVESDFFAREADLYKRDTEDNFADLDEPAGRKGGARSPAGRRQSKR